MKKSAIVEWLQREFLPLTLATPTETVDQLVDNAIRYWNTHSAYKHVQMYNSPSSGSRVQLDKRFKNVVEVFPDRTTTWIFNDHPLWTLLGISILDNVTTDLIILSETYRNYRNYLGVQMTWKWERSEDPATGGYLYIKNLPVGTQQVYVLGTKRLYNTDDIVSEHILHWLLRYCKALLKQVEGNTLRKSDIIGVKNDGQAQFDEGKDEVEKLQEELRLDGRWVAFARRF